MRLRGYGIEVDLPAGWDGRIYRRPRGEATLHAANFPLPPEDGEFGISATAAMPADGVFVALTEYRRKLAGKGLFAHRGLPLPLRQSDPDPRTLLLARPGQAAIQRFCTVTGRPFCLYLVVGPPPSRAALLRRTSSVLESVSIAPS